MFERESSLRKVTNLQSEEDEEGNHQTEETHGFGEGKTQNGVGKELLLEGGVTGVSDDEGAENCSDSSSRSGDANGSGTSTDEFGGGVNISSLGGDGERSKNKSNSHFVSFSRN